MNLNNEDNEQSSNKGKNIIKKTFDIGSMLKKGIKLKLLLLKILVALKFLFFALLIALGLALFFLIIITIIFIIKTLIDDPMGLISMGIGLVGTVVLNPLGQIIGIDLKPLEPISNNNIPVYNYIISGKNKSDILNDLNISLENKTKNISSKSNIESSFDTYKQTYGSKILSFFGKDDLNENFEEAKKIINELYKVKYNKRKSDYLFFDLLLGSKYNNFYNLGDNILKDIKNIDLDTGMLKSLSKQGINTMEQLNSYILKDGYKGIVITNSGGINNFYSTLDLTKFKYKGDKKYYTFESKINGEMNINVDKMLEYFYFRKSINDYLIAYGGKISDNSSNDIKTLISLDGDKQILTNEIDNGKIGELNAVLNFKEKQFINELYKNNKNLISIYNNSKLLTFKEIEYSKKEIIKIYLNRYFNLYKDLNNNSIVLSLSFYGLPGLVQGNATCQITQLYGKSNASNKYVKGLHNGYDMVFSNQTILSMSDGKVIKSGYDDELGNYLLIEGDLISSYGGKKVTFLFEYLHMNSISVKKGDKVSIGQSIGVQGNMGNSKGKHLHLSIYPHEINSSQYYNSHSGYLKAINFDNFFKAVGTNNIFKKQCNIGKLSSNIGNIW